MNKPSTLLVPRPHADYPRPLTPEHDKRNASHDANFDERDSDPLHPDVSAAYNYVDSVINTSDYTNPPAWHGWAIREAFLAGITHQQNQSIQPNVFAWFNSTHQHQSEGKLDEGGEQILIRCATTAEPWGSFREPLYTVKPLECNHLLEQQNKQLLEALKQSNEIVSLIANHGSPDDEDAETCGTLMHRNLKLILDAKAGK